MIRRSKKLCAVLAVGMVVNLSIYAGNTVPVFASNKTTEQSTVESGKTYEINGMKIKNGVLVNGKNAKGDVEIPSDVTKIGEGAFKFNNDITSVKIPSSITEIDEYAFEECKNLTKANIPGSVKNISKCAFINCNLKDVTIDDGVETIGDQAFAFNKSLKKIDIPDSVTLIKLKAFYKCEKLMDIHYNSSAELEIDAFSFTAKKNSADDFLIKDGVLKDVNEGISGPITIPEGVKKIEARAFSGRYDLTEINLPESLEVIGDEAFFGCGLNTIKLPKNLKTIGNSAFELCSELKEISIPDSVTSIGNKAFNSCTSLENINLNAKDKTIGENAFPMGVKINGKNNLQNQDGVPSNAMKVLKPGWNLIEGCWYYADESGNMYKNKWYFNGSNWYYMNSEGRMYTSGPWEIDGNNYYFEDSTGEMITGWKDSYKLRGWHYFNPYSDGSMGAMVKSKWVYTGGKWYYLNEYGAMARNTTIDGYYVDDDGAWVE